MDYTIKLKCDICQKKFEIDLKDYDLSWEIIDSDEHGENGMGQELHHQSVLELECPYCIEDEQDIVTITLSVWEYPIGAYNNQEIEVDGAELVKECNLQGLAPIGDIE